MAEELLFGNLSGCLGSIHFSVQLLLKADNGPNCAHCLSGLDEGAVLSYDAVGEIGIGH